ncbi:uncharacterized protein LOC116352658 isoform X2 [Contarinia nasturtii]|uniref:uncharacterized protein LOC116352658 isoform X2 n=1 Tax=Contarinia nasturtii TaxID=265458 RepID=UPI0012D434D8|nr:uncharacterized protein LOC116352658 isoform X2 [Contarinia nasturtii]
MFHEHNELIRRFEIALDRMPTDNHRIVIRADKRPVGDDARRFNAPAFDSNDVAIVIVGAQFEPRDIVLKRRNDILHRISETHRSYDALQYPILFPYGEDGYHFNIKMKNPTTGVDVIKKVSAMNYYGNRLMLRENEDNYIVKGRHLFHQFVVDMSIAKRPMGISYKKRENLR